MAEQDRKVYRLPPFRRGIAPAAVLAAGIIMVAAPWNPAGNNPVWVSALGSSIALPLLAFAAAMYAGRRYMRLTVSERDIELREAYLKFFGRVWGFTVETPWDNVEKLYDEPGTRPVLELRSPMTSKGADWLRKRGNARKTPIYNAGQLALINERRLIPLHYFAYLFKDGTLQDDFARYAPWLL